MVELNVNLENTSYKIHIGTAWSDSLAGMIERAKVGTKGLVITDSNVYEFYGRQIIDVIKSAGVSAETYVIPAGEESKSAETAIAIYTKAIKLGLDRKSPIIALGGGVVGDLAGFIAATYLRGVPFIQIPTTLLAQVDSSVGGKVAINHPLGKNLIGAFYQPQFVFIDTAFLNTLPEREVSTGLAEVIKYGVIADADFFNYLTHTSDSILTRHDKAFTKIIKRSCEIKAEVVGADERETGLRAILNFGHTIAHGVEAFTKYKKYNHGEAVAIGMHGAAVISQKLGLCSIEVVEKIKHIITEFKLPLKAKDCPADAIFPILFRDKKVINGTINWVLVNNIGNVSIVNNVPLEIIKEALNEIT